MTPAQRRLGAQIAANTRWSQTPDRTAATAAARQAADARFEALVDPNSELAPDVRARLAENARKAHFQRMNAKSAATRARRKSNPAA
jgi:hypothetical protein